MANIGIEPVMNTLMSPLIGSCGDTREQLSEHLEGSLTSRGERRVTRHLRLCRRCRAIYESLTRTVESVRNLGRQEETEPIPSLADNVIERIRRPDL
jgi:predicted anti-sigma-YlaC factor YlaD